VHRRAAWSSPFAAAARNSALQLGFTLVPALSDRAEIKGEYDRIFTTMVGDRVDAVVGAACALMIAYDTSLRPGDIRSIKFSQLHQTHIVLEQSKTGRPQHSPIWDETTYDLIERYLAYTGLKMHPGAILLRTPTTHGRYRGVPFTKYRLSKDIRKILDAAGIPRAVQMRDLRRTASVERAEAGATAAELAAGTDHSIERSQKILDTYNPASYTMTKNAQDKRLDRQKSRNGTG